MEGRAEINKFAIFLFCLLVPLGSSAPTETSESKLTTGHRQKRFTTDIPSMSAVIEDLAHDLFEFYQKCISGTFHPEPQKIKSKARDMAVERITDCPAFHANCCVLHDIQNILRTLKSDMKTICKDNPEDIIKANINQLNTTLTQGTTFYTCKAQDLPQGQTMGPADSKTYIWFVLQRYEDITQKAVKLHSETAA